SEAGAPSIRHRNPGMVCTWVTEKPAPCRAAAPEDGSPDAQRTLVLPFGKVTTTVTPLEVEVQAAASAVGAAMSSPAPARARLDRTAPAGRRMRWIRLIGGCHPGLSRRLRCHRAGRAAGPAG